MRRATITMYSDLADAVERYRCDQEAPPALTAIVQAALRQFLVQRGYMDRPSQLLRITPASIGSGRNDVSDEHDRYLAET